jgi:hypothetical protein
LILPRAGVAHRFAEGDLHAGELAGGWLLDELPHQVRGFRARGQY